MILTHCKNYYDDTCDNFLNSLLDREDEWYDFFKIKDDKGGEFFKKYFPNLTGEEKL